MSQGEESSLVGVNTESLIISFSVFLVPPLFHVNIPTLVVGSYSSPPISSKIRGGVGSDFAIVHAQVSLLSTNH